LKEDKSGVVRLKIAYLLQPKSPSYLANLGQPYHQELSL